jgi:asparagine synthase (glutamine-hydrolysing)
MCGIAGIINSALGSSELEVRLADMQRRLQHRGPDGQGTYVAPNHSVAFSHTRLSIIDLSAAGDQPMFSTGGRYVIVFNGEIYNYEQLRDELAADGATFQSHSDTEVVLQMYMRVGKHCVDKLQGMFAFAIWDQQAGSCFLARDPLGIKPLYLWESGGCLAFASEIRALLEADLGPRRLDAEALHAYLLFGSVQEPRTLVENIRVLPAGHRLEWSSGKVHEEPYWQLQLGIPAVESSVSGRPAHAERVREAVVDSVRRHFVSDVPVSLFLSGGIDSTAIAALAKHCGFDNLRTFSISFDEHEFNEGDLAARTADHFGTEHHDWRMQDVDGRDLIHEFLDALDQPSNDGFNTFCVSKFAHDSGAKVVLSGLGGDELFGGYPSFSRVPWLMDSYRKASLAGSLPRRMAAAAFRAMGSTRWQRMSEFLNSSGDVCAAYWTMRGFFLNSEANRLVEHYTGLSGWSIGDVAYGPLPNAENIYDAVSELEATRYMRNQLLRDSDVMSMAWGLELRVPLVDSRLVESIADVPSMSRLASGKRLLLDAVPEIPEWIRQQPKRGFRFPFERWIAHAWGDIFHDLTASSPVPLNTWYRRWSLFTLEHFLCTNRIECGRSLTNNCGLDSVTSS